MVNKLILCRGFSCLIHHSNIVCQHIYKSRGTTLHNLLSNFFKCFWFFSNRINCKTKPLIFRSKIQNFHWNLGFIIFIIKYSCVFCFDLCSFGFRHNFRLRFCFGLRFALCCSCRLGLCFRFCLNSSFRFRPCFRNSFCFSLYYGFGLHRSFGLFCPYCVGDSCCRSLYAAVCRNRSSGSDGHFKGTLAASCYARIYELEFFFESLASMKCVLNIKVPVFISLQVKHTSGYRIYKACFSICSKLRVGNGLTRHIQSGFYRFHAAVCT